MDIKIIAQLRELEIGKNPGKKIVMRHSFNLYEPKSPIGSYIYYARRQLSVLISLGS
jgi:hypothetical protein